MRKEKALPRSFVWLRVFGLGACLLLSAPLAARAQGGDEAALRGLLEKFFSAYRAKDLKGLEALWGEQSRESEDGKDALKRDLEAHEKLAVKGLSVVALTVEGEKASARLAVEVTAPGAPEGGVRKLNRTAHFVKEGGAWKLRHYAPSEEELASQLVGAAPGADRQALLDKEKELLTAELVGGLLTRGRQLFLRGELAQALTVYELALGVAEKIGDRAGMMAVLGHIGNIHETQGSYTQALEFSRRSLKLAEEAGDKRGVAAALNSLGNTLDYMGEVSSALEHYRRGLAMATEAEDRVLLARLHNNIGLVHRSQGDPLRALEHIQRSLKLAEEAKDRVSILRALHNVGIVHAWQGNYEQAFEYYQKSLAIAEQLGAKTLVPRILGNMGIAQAARGKHAEALEYHRKASERGQEIGDKEVVAGTFNNIGDVYGNVGEYGPALEHFRKGLRLAEELGNTVLIAGAHEDMAEAHRRLGEHRKALEHAERSAALFVQAGRPNEVSYARTISGKAQLALGEWEPARRSLLEAINTVERLREQVVGGEQERQLFFERQVEPYYAMVELMLARRDDFEALAYAERAKARVLLDVLGSGRADISKAMTAEERARERALGGEVQGLNTQILREKSAPQPDAARLKELDARLQKARLEYESFQTGLYAAHPELRLRRGRQAPSLTREQLASLLPDAKTALLEFVVGEDASHLFVLTRGAGGRGAVELKSYRLNVKAKELASRVEDVRGRLAERNLDFRGQARGLYDLLLGPAREQLRGRAVLCVVPDGALWELPFQALQPRDGAYLIEDHAVFYTPSLSVLHGMERLPGRGRAPVVAAPARDRAPLLLAFGNPSLGPSAVEFVRSAYRDERLGPLPEAEKEVRALQEFYTPARSRVYVGEEASEERVKAEVGDYRVVHFAAHGVLDDRNPMYSHVLLSQTGAGGGEDGLLHAREVMGLDLKADLVVLSGCQTARGRHGAGEGVIGRSWALFVAGSPTAVLSLWKVESSSTAELMVGFHKHLTARGAGRDRGRRKAEALRAASLELLKGGRYQHPFYWAGFVMTGNGL